MSEYQRYCVVCGVGFSGDSALPLTCSNACTLVDDRDVTKSLRDAIGELVPKALDVLGHASVDDYERAKRDRGRVYFIQCGDDGPIKIGHSVDVHQRLSDLQVSSPETLTLLASVRGNRSDEKRIHSAFGALRIRGEWFQPAERLREFIATI